VHCLRRRRAFSVALSDWHRRNVYNPSVWDLFELLA
jgi:hypothetical protein